MTTWADPSAVAAVNWSDGQLICRARNRHNWVPHTVTHDANGYVITERCPQCKNKRWCNMTNSGYIDHWRPLYDKDLPEDAQPYLTKGMGRIDNDGRAVLRLKAIRLRRVRELTE